jgi:hypothetical protein
MHWLGGRVADILQIRRAKPPLYPDQSVYAEYASAALGLDFVDIDDGTGLVFYVASGKKRVYFGAGRASFYPQNSATAADLVTDKYFANRILDREGMKTLGGEYFFLHDRHRAYRTPGHERQDALEYFATLQHSAFIKPLHGARGDFAQPVHGAASFEQYIESVSKYHDSIIIQRIFSGVEYRVFVMDDSIVYSARKQPPYIVGDGIRTIRDIIADYNLALHHHGISSVYGHAELEELGGSQAVPAKGERLLMPGRMNRSAGGSMHLEDPVCKDAIFALARDAARVFGLRVSGVDILCEADTDPAAARIIEVNQNPSIRLLEDCNRPDLILQIWRQTFSAMGLVNV